MLPLLRIACTIPIYCVSVAAYGPGWSGARSGPFRCVAARQIGRNKMILCSCNALRESQVREIARGGVRCEREAYQRLGCRPQCGQCLPHARQLVREESGRVAS